MTTIFFCLGLLAQPPMDFTPLVFEAEAWSGPATALKENLAGPNHWNRWSTDKDAARKWSGGVVLQSPVVKADRATPDEGAPPLHTRITGIRPGRYEVQLKIGRTLAVSLDGKKWEKRDGGNASLGVFDVAGTFELWVDDRYAHAPAPGSAYFDAVLFQPVLPRVEKPKVAGFAATRVRERLDRGLVAAALADRRVYLSWRLLADEPRQIGFKVYRHVDGKVQRLNDAPLTRTCDYVDTPPPDCRPRYSVRTTVAGVEGPASAAVVPLEATGPTACQVIDLDAGATVQKVGIGDLDGDGRYDYLLKTPQDNIDPANTYWKPSPDTYHLQAYSADGRRMWDKDLGWAIERGIWYSPAIVFDLDGDGRAEVAVKTGAGDPRGADGRVESGDEWLSILDGRTGAEVARTPWLSRHTPGETYRYNYASRNQICIAYLDGKTPAVVINRGTYTTIRLAAYHFHQGALAPLWTWDSREEAGRGRYNSQGAHIMHAADVDADGRDEVIVGSATVDDNGNGLWTTGLGHPDFCFVGEIDPRRPGLEIFYGIEPPLSAAGLCLADARSGQLLWKLPVPTNHVGTDGMCADIDPRHPGSECYAADIDKDRKFAQAWLYSAQGTLLSSQRQRSIRLPVHWDADPQRELIRGSIDDFEGASLPARIVGSVVAVADVFGDWREEIITTAPGRLRIYTTTVPAVDRRPALMTDPIYRIDVAVALMGYYAPPMLSYDVERDSTRQVHGDCPDFRGAVRESGTVPLGRPRAQAHSRAEK